MHHHVIFRFADWVRRRWAVLGFIATVLIALAPLNKSFVDPGFPEWIYVAFFWTAIAVVLVVVLCWLLCCLGEQLERDVVEKFECATRDEIQEVLPFYDRVIGGGQRPSVNALKAMFSANKNIFRFYKRKSMRGEKKIVEVKGFCTVIPMNKAAEELLRKGELNGLKMDGTHIAGVKDRCSVFYIGSIGGEGAHAKAAVLTYVLGVVDEFSQRGCTRVYTRPITTDGLRVAKAYGFVRADGDGALELGELCYKEIGDEPVQKIAPRGRPRKAAVAADNPVVA